MDDTAQQPLAMLVDGTAEAEAIGAALEEEGLQLVHASDTIAAESLFVAHRPSLIVLSLDDEGASAFCDLISAIPRGSGVPVILVGKPNETLRAPVEASLTGAHAFIPRPVDNEELITTVREMMGNSDVEPDGDDAPEPDTREQTSLQELPGFIEGVAPREPTQVLSSEAQPSADGLLDHSFGFSLTDFLADAPMGFGLDNDTSDGPHPWEISVDMPGIAEEDFVEDELTDGDTTHLEDGDEADDDAPSLTLDDEEESPWTPTHDSSPARPERTQILSTNAKPEPVVATASKPTDVTEEEPPSEEGSVEHDAEVTQLSADFQRVIDEVAQRLFPEASPDEYGDEHFEELSTIVPVVDPQAGEFDDLDDYSLEAMETFTAGQGFTLSPYGSPLSGDAFPEDTQNEGPVGAPPTEERSDEIAEPPTFEAEPSPHFDGASTNEQTHQAELHLLREEPHPSEETDAAPPPELILDEERLTYGEIAHYSVPRLFAAAIRSRFSGTIVFRLPGHQANEKGEPSVSKRTIVFDKGAPVVATTGLTHERMVELLLKKGRISRDHYEQCREQVELTSRRAGTVLVDLGAISASELFPLVRWHFRELIIASFSARQGTFWVESNPPLTQWRIKLEPEGPHLLLEGLKRRWSAEELESQLQPDSRLRLASSTAEADLTQVAGLTPEEVAVIKGCDGAHSLEHLLQSTSLDRGQTLALLTGLTLLGMVRQRATVMPEPDSEKHLLERKRLEQRLERCWESDYFTILGVSTDASLYEMRQAHAEILSELEPTRLAAIAAADLDERLEDLRYVLDEALQVLADESLRQAYLAARFHAEESHEGQ